VLSSRVDLLLLKYILLIVLPLLLLIPKLDEPFLILEMLPYKLNISFLSVTLSDEWLKLGEEYVLEFWLNVPLKLVDFIKFVNLGTLVDRNLKLLELLMQFSVDVLMLQIFLIALFSNYSPCFLKILCLFNLNRSFFITDSKLSLHF